MHHDLIHIFGYLGVDTRNETVEQIQARFESLRDYQKVEFEVVRGILPAELADYVIKSEPDVFLAIVKSVLKLVLSTETCTYQTS